MDAFRKQLEKLPLADIRKYAGHYFSRGNYTNAHVAYDLITSMDLPKEEMAKIYTNMALCSLKMFEYQKALEAAEKSRQLDPSWVKGDLRYIAALIGLKEFQKAVEEIEKLRALDPQPLEFKQLEIDALAGMATFEDISEAKDKSLMLAVLKKGGELARVLDTVSLHYRKKNKVGQVFECSRTHYELNNATMALVQREDLNTPFKEFVVGENEVPPMMEKILEHVGEDGIAVLQMTKRHFDDQPEEQMSVTLEVGKIKRAIADKNDPRFKGEETVYAETIRASRFLQESNVLRDKVEAFDNSKSNENQLKAEVISVITSLKETARFARRRFERALGMQDGSNPTILAQIYTGLAKSIIFEQTVFLSEMGEGAKDYGRNLNVLLSEKQNVVTADRAQLEKALEYAQKAVELEDSQSVMHCLGMCHLALEDYATAKETLEKALAYDKFSKAVKDDLARLTRLTSKSVGKQAAQEMEQFKISLDEAVEKEDIAAIRTAMNEIGRLVDEENVAWEVLMRLKVGKVVGSIQKNPPGGDAELAKEASTLVHKFRLMAEKQRPLWS